MNSSFLAVQKNILNNIDVKHYIKTLLKTKVVEKCNVF